MRAAMLVVIPLVGCWGPVETVFPDGVEPLENNTAPEVSEDGPEYVDFTWGEDDGLYWVHGRGLIHAPMVDVVAALSDPAVVQDRRGVDEWALTDAVEAEYDPSFAIVNTTREIITVEWTVTWRGLVVVGDAEEPEVFAMRYQKTDGSSLIDTMEGSIVVRALSDDRTEIQLIEHLAAPRITEVDLLCYQQDLFTEVVTTTDGEPLPEYEEGCR